MELKQIKMQDIVPDENNPRRDFGDLHALARTFEANTYAPGQPYNAIVVVADGDGYRIADGERRYRAMLLNDIQECNAVVCGDYEEADSMIAMLASDDKEPLSATERSTAVQRALLLGVAPNVVESIGRLKRGQAKKVKSMMGKSSEAIQASLDQMLEAYALREDGATPDEVERVLEAEDEDWSTVASDVRHRMEVEAFRTGAEEILGKAGFELSDERPEITYQVMCFELDDLQDALEKGVPEDACFWISTYPQAVEVFYEDDERDERPAADEQLDIAKAVLEDANKRRAAWYAGALDTDRSGRRVKHTPHVDALLISRAQDTHSVKNFREKAGFDGTKMQPSELLGVCAEDFYVGLSSEYWQPDARDLLAWDDRDPWIEHWERILEWVDACAADGYVMRSDEADLLAVAREHVSMEPAPADAVEPAAEEQDDQVTSSAAAETTEVFIPVVSDESLEIQPADDAELDLSAIAFDGKVVA